MCHHWDKECHPTLVHMVIIDNENHNMEPHNRIWMFPKLCFMFHQKWDTCCWQGQLAKTTSWKFLSFLQGFQTSRAQNFQSFKLEDLRLESQKFLTYCSSELPKTEVYVQCAPGKYFYDWHNHDKYHYFHMQDHSDQLIVDLTSDVQGHMI